MLSEPTRAALNCKECSNKAIKRGLCQTHYLKEWYEQKTDICFADKCERLAWSKGMCLKHYKRQWRHGSVDTTLCAPNDCPVAERLSRVGWTETKSGCWEWRGRRLKGGYGQLDFEGKGVQAHRIAYETWVGEIPKDLIVRHKCDNPPCINPDHLETGTYQDNADDMVQRGRHNPVRGTKNANAKLTDRDVLEIRKLRAAGALSRELSEKFGVSEANISSIARRSSWKHI